MSSTVFLSVLVKIKANFFYVYIPLTTSNNLNKSRVGVATGCSGAVPLYWENTVNGTQIPTNDLTLHVKYVHCTRKIISVQFTFCILHIIFSLQACNKKCPSTIREHLEVIL